MRAASFIEILVDQIRDEVREEVMQEFGHVAQAPPSPEARLRAHQASQVELWLSLNLQPKVTVKRAYGKTAARPALKLAAPAAPALSSERRGSATTIEQLLALEFFNREGSALLAEFSESEFKTAFRKLALRLHPDRHMQASSDERASFTERFTRLTECADLLASTLV